MRGTHAQNTTLCRAKLRRQRAERIEWNGKVKGEFSWFKSVFLEASRLWEQQDQLLRKSSQSKLLNMILESM